MPSTLPPYPTMPAAHFNSDPGPGYWERVLVYLLCLAFCLACWAALLYTAR